MLSQKLKLMLTMATEAMVDTEAMEDTDTVANADLLLLKLPQLHTTDMVVTEDTAAMEDTDMAANEDPLNHTMVMEVMVDTEGTDTDMDVKILSCMKYINKSFPFLLNIQRNNHYASPMILLSQKYKGDF